MNYTELDIRDAGTNIINTSCYPGLDKITHRDADTGFIFHDSLLYNRRRGENTTHGIQVYSWHEVAEGCQNMSQFNNSDILTDDDSKPMGATNYSFDIYKGKKVHKWFSKTKNGIFLLSWTYVYEGSKGYSIFKRSNEISDSINDIDFTICTVVHEGFYNDKYMSTANTQLK